MLDLSSKFESVGETVFLKFLSNAMDILKGKTNELMRWSIESGLSEARDSKQETLLIEAEAQELRAPKQKNKV